MTKLILFDGNAIMHRAFHALPPLTTPVGEPINAVYGLISMLLRVIQDLQPTHIAFAFDRPEPTFRKEMYVEYQSQRPEMDDELGSQFEKAYAVIKAFGIPIYSKAGFEADDVIGTIAHRSNVDEVVIVTGDRDMLQLVNDKTKLFMPGKGLLSSTLYGERETEERMGVKPKQVIDLKGLIGDASDNYKGVPGVGPKTALKLLNQYGSFEGIYKNLDDVPESVRQKLETHKESADMSYDLARIRTDVDVEFNLEDAEKWVVDSTEVRRVFETFGFKTLAKRVKAVNEELQKQNQQGLL
jgi:DNA polymerase I